MLDVKTGLSGRVEECGSGRTSRLPHAHHDPAVPDLLHPDLQTSTSTGLSASRVLMIPAGVANTMLLSSTALVAKCT